MQDQRADLEWRDGAVPVSTRFDDPYFSLENGLAETRHTFLAGNGLPARFRDGFHIAELGFGTGLNALATLQAWMSAGAPGRLDFTSFEAYPMDAAAMEQALSAFPELAPLAARLIDAWASGAAGYLKKAYVIEQMRKAGFEYVASSDINENPKDQPTSDDIVWRLPPSLQTSKNDADKRAAMQAIGESNRMTLKFVKPGA